MVHSVYPDESDALDDVVSNDHDVSARDETKVAKPTNIVLSILKVHDAKDDGRDGRGRKGGIHETTGTDATPGSNA